MRLAMPVYGKNAKRELVTEFRGLNSTDMGGDSGGKSTFTKMLNGGTDKYPFAASRLPRRKTQYDEATCALSGGEVLTRVQPPYLIYGDRQYDLGISHGEKQIVRMGTNILIFPDGKYFNTANGEYGDMNEGVEYTETAKVSMIYFTDGSYMERSDATTGEDGSLISVNYVFSSGSIEKKRYLAWDYYCIYTERKKEITVDVHSKNVPFAYEDGSLYYLSEYDESNPESKKVVWKKLEIEKIRLKDIENTEVFSLSNIWCGDQYVKLESEKLTYETRYYILLLPGQKISDLCSLILPTYSNDNYMSARYSWKTRTLPIFDYVTVCDNRLWGCRCGMPYDGSEPVNRIYVSAPNDFKAFEQFAAISTDSWWGDVSEEGPFTGACTYNGYPMFFKENYLYILYGDYPPYSFNPIKLRGVADGAAKSLVEINGALYYKSRHDIMRYTGSSLNSISEALGDISDVSRAVGGTYRDGYYISLDGDIYVYDTAKGLWSKENKLPVIDFANVRGETHFLTEGGAVYTVNGGEESMQWSLTSPPIGYAYPNRKRLSSLQIRIEIGEGDELPTVELSLDGGEFKECSPRVNFIDGDGKRTGTIFIPILPGRCELFRYRISGKGSYKLTGVTKTLKECGK